MSSLAEIQVLIQRKYGLGSTLLGATASMSGRGVDSLALVELLYDVEDHFGISVPESHSGIDTLTELAAVVDQLVAAKAAKAEGNGAALAPATDNSPAA